MKTKTTTLTSIVLSITLGCTTPPKQETAQDILASQKLAISATLTPQSQQSPNPQLRRQPTEAESNYVAQCIVDINAINRRLPQTQAAFGEDEKNLKQLTSELEKYADMFSTEIIYHKSLAQAYFRLNDHKKVMHEVWEVCRLDSKEPETYQNLVAAYINTKKIHRALPDATAFEKKHSLKGIRERVIEGMHYHLSKKIYELFESRQLTFTKDTARLLWTLSDSRFGDMVWRIRYASIAALIDYSIAQDPGQQQKAIGTLAAVHTVENLDGALKPLAELAQQHTQRINCSELQRKQFYQALARYNPP